MPTDTFYMTVFFKQYKMGASKLSMHVYRFPLLFVLPASNLPFLIQALPFF